MYDFTDVNIFFFQIGYFRLQLWRSHSLHTTIKSFHCTRRQNSLWRSAYSHQYIHACVWHCRQERPQNISICMQCNPCACFSNLLYHNLVARFIQDINHQIIYFFTFRLCYSIEIFCNGFGNVYRIFSLLSYYQFIHIKGTPWIPHTSLVRSGYCSNGIGSSKGKKISSLHWIHSDIYTRSIPISHRFAIVEHRCIIFFSFADNDSSVDIYIPKRFTHPIHCRFVPSVLISCSYKSSRRKRRRFGNSHEFHCDIII